MKQFLSYFVIGGTSAIVEWSVFSLLIFFTDISYMPAAAMSFILSTTTNWYLGRTFTFKNSKAYKDKRIKEYLMVFFVSAVGLGFNMILMYLFVEVIGMDTNIMKTAAKIMSTGIVFMWNFVSRKYWVYRDQ